LARWELKFEEADTNAPFSFGPKPANPEDRKRQSQVDLSDLEEVRPKGRFRSPIETIRLKAAWQRILASAWCLAVRDYWKMRSKGDAA
jgi:hypothetical protein